eukprot:snap_masked-scaffold_1-processed-gene-22.39-mRNA-1 protein AED:0.37 eAED:0.37 QI:0/-1/0/1/-1/1/1/0/367
MKIYRKEKQISRDVVIFEVGSYYSRFGLSTKEFPEYQQRAIVGKLKTLEFLRKLLGDRLYVGEEALNRRGVLTMKSPLSAGILTNWETMFDIWHHSFFNVLKVDPKEVGLLLIQKPLSPKLTNFRVKKVLREKIGFQDVILTDSCTLALAGHGIDSGVVLDVGEQVSAAFPMYKGFLIYTAISSTNFGGADLSHILLNILNEEGIRLWRIDETVQDIKENLCEVLYDFDFNISVDDFPGINYEFPDGRQVLIRRALFEPGEVLFNPEVWSTSKTSVCDLLYLAINRSGTLVQDTIRKNIVTTGDSLRMRGFHSRLEKELGMKFSSSQEFKVHADGVDTNCVWKGAAAFSSSTAFASTSLSQEYIADT